MERNICPNCKKENHPQAKFCKFCGTPLEEKNFNLCDNGVEKGVEPQWSTSYEIATKEETSGNSSFVQRNPWKKYFLAGTVILLFLISFLLIKVNQPSKEKIDKAFSEGNYAYVIEKGTDFGLKNKDAELLEKVILAKFKLGKNGEALNLYERAKEEKVNFKEDLFLLRVAYHYYVQGKEEDAMKIYHDLFSHAETFQREYAAAYMQGLENYYLYYLDRDNASEQENFQKISDVYGYGISYYLGEFVVNPVPSEERNAQFAMDENPPQDWTDLLDMTKEDLEKEGVVFEEEEEVPSQQEGVSLDTDAKRLSYVENMVNGDPDITITLTLLQDDSYTVESIDGKKGNLQIYEGNFQVEGDAAFHPLNYLLLLDLDSAKIYSMDRDKLDEVIDIQTQEHYPVVAAYHPN